MLEKTFGKKLVIQIPCLNEEETLPTTLAAIPRSFKGIDEVIVLVIDDGCTDKTVEVAKKNGVQHILSHRRNRGLAYAFNSGLTYAMRIRADFLVNLDADNQYNAGDIQCLLDPLLEETADIVVGERPIKEIASFSPIKKLLQVWGSYSVKLFSEVELKDAPSGFRAFNSRAIHRLHIFNAFSHTLETLIIAKQYDLTVVGVPIRVNGEVLRPSRLFSSIPAYIYSSVKTILRFYMLYNPYGLFMKSGVLFGLLSSVLYMRFFYFYFYDLGDGWIQSLVVATGLLMISLFLMMGAIMCDLISINRKLILKNLTEFRESENRVYSDPRDQT